MKKKPLPHPVLLVGALTAALRVAGAPATEIQLLPVGEFRARDGRPTECATWRLNAELAAKIIALADSRETPFVIDYEHQTLKAATNGKEAPAAGWFKKLEWREGVGLFAVDVTWTAKASGYIDADEYKFISPVFFYDAKGNITEILMAAITNNPGLDGMDEVMSAAASRLVVSLTTQTVQESEMDEELLERLRWMLNLPVASTAADIRAQLEKLIEMIGGDVAATTFDLIAHVQGRDLGTQQQIAVLTANQVNPATHVPVATMVALQQQIVDLQTQIGDGGVDQLVMAALSDGRLLPVQEAWARDLGASNVAGLRTFLDSAPRIAALTTTQTHSRQEPAAREGDALDPDFVAVCAQFGNDPKEVQQYVLQEK